MRDPLSWVPIKYKLTLTFVVVSLLAFGIGGLLVSRFARNALEREIGMRLRASVDAYEQALEGSLVMLGRRMQDFASDGLIRRVAEEAAAGPATRSHPGLRRHLARNKLPLVGCLEDLVVLDPRGHRIAGVSPAGGSDPQVQIPEKPEADPVYTGFMRPPAGGHGSRFGILTTVWSLDGERVVGHLLALVDTAVWIAGTELPVPESPGAQAHDTELVLVDGQGAELLVPWWLQRGDPGSTRKLQQEGLGPTLTPTGDEPAPAGAVAGARRPESVYASTRSIGDVGWTARLQVDATEAMDPVRGLDSRFLAAGLVTALVLVVLLWFPLKFLVIPLGRLRDMAARMADGELGVRVPARSEDEIGDLARAFNTMAGAVEERTTRLETEHHRLEAVMGAMGDALMLLDGAGRVVLSNAAARPLIEAIGGRKGVLEARQCRDPGTQDCASCLAEGRKRRGPCLVDLGESVYEVVVTTLPVPGEEPGRVLVGRDVTERAAMHDRQAHQERLAVLGEVAAVVAHEINNPLAAISMFNQMMADSLDPQSPFRENVEVIARNTDACKRAIRDLLDNARCGAPDVGEVHVHDMLGDVVRFLRVLSRKSGVSLELRPEAGDAVVTGDEDLLRQVFVNLVVNGIQALGGGPGAVKVTTRVAPTPGGETLMVEVRDEGPGVPEEHRDRIFDPFFTTKGEEQQGTGLGLPTSKRTVEAHGGTLELMDGSPGRTTFRVRLPLSAGACRRRMGAGLQESTHGG